MWVIQKLPKILANQIAAWEVVERPVSVIKELVENSIDAWATSIKIDIKNWGVNEIVVSDNWNWIDRDDLELLTEKHTTSKIKNLEDLHKIMTFWFRGEALASISSVSKFKIISKNFNSISWYSLEVTWWEKQKISNDVIDSWTKIIVKDLFYNTPARLNYLKKEKTEYTHIYDFLNNIALAHPGIWFEFTNDDRQVFKYKENEELKTRIYNIYGEDFYSNLLELNFDFSWLKITWYISNPKISFPNKNRQTTFVNWRVISSSLVYKAISEAYNRFIPHNNFPWYILNLTINPEEIDVNVHPRKQEIRFAREQDIYRAFYHAVFSKLENSSLVSENAEYRMQNVWTSHSEFISESLTQWLNQKQSTKDVEINLASQSVKQNYYTWSGTKFKSYSPYKDISVNPSQIRIENEEVWCALDFTKAILWWNNTEVWDLHYTKLGKIIWQAFNSYILVENDNKLIMFDQHALAERIIYEKLVKSDLDTISQKLLVWENINLNQKEISILENYKNVFENMWFEFEVLSNWSVLLSSIPNFVKKEDIKNIFIWVIDDVWEFNTWKSVSLEEVRNKICAYTACRSAIKFWNKLNLFEMNKLINESIEWYSSSCPHGRPVIYEIGMDELKKKYER